MTMTTISSSLAEALRRLYETGEYADAYVSYGGVKRAVHQMVVCSQSEALRAACLDAEGVPVIGVMIDLEHEEASLVEFMISFLYFGDYHFPDVEHDEGIEYDNEEDEEGAKHGSDKDTDEASQLLVHARMYVMANKYGIPALRDLAKQAYEEAINQCWESHIFLESVLTIFDKTGDADGDLQDLLISTCSSRLRDFMNDPDLKILVKDLFHTLPAFSWELFDRHFSDSRLELKEEAVIATPATSDVSEHHTAELVHHVETCNCEDSLERLQNRDADYFVYASSDGITHSAPMFKTRKAAEENGFSWIQVVSPTTSCGQHIRQWYLWILQGEVKGMEGAYLNAEGDGTLDSAVAKFYGKFKIMTGHSWADRTSQPKKGCSMYVKQNYQGMWSKEWPLRIIKQNVAFIDRSSFRKKRFLDDRICLYDLGN